MNILVRTAGGRTIVRPDTTWERDNEDLYLPEFVDRLSYAPVFFARVSKPGRSVSVRFADRYYDAIGFGVLLYPENLVDGSEEGFACASCLDHTSFLSYPLYNKLTLGREGNVFELSKDGIPVFSFNKADGSMVLDAIEEVTKYCYIRVGDLVAIELQERRPLCSRGDGKTAVRGVWCDNHVLDFNVVF